MHAEQQTLRDVATLRDWNMRNNYRPYQMKQDISTGEVVELISFPWWDEESDSLKVNVRTPHDPGTLRTVEWPNLLLAEVGQVAR